MNKRIAQCTAIVILALGAAVSSCDVPFFDSFTLMSGTISAETVTLSAGTSGEVVQITKAPGDRVKKGELLVRLDASDSAGELARAKKRLADAAEQEKNAKEEFDRTTAEVSYSWGRYLTFTYLLKKGAVAPREVDRLKDEWEFAEDQNKKATMFYERAKADLIEARDDLAKTEAEYGSVFILAPTDGFLTRLMTWEGGYLLKGDEALTVAHEGDVYFTGRLTDNREVPLGADVTVLPLAIPTGPINGYVAALTDGNGANDHSRVVTVRLFPKRRKDVANIGKTAWAMLNDTR